MEDGLYLIRRRRQPVESTVRTLFLRAYNDNYAKIKAAGAYDNSCFTVRAAANWSGQGHFNFVQDTGLYYLLAGTQENSVTFKIRDPFVTIKDGETGEELPMACQAPGSNCPHNTGSSCYYNNFGTYCTHFWGKYKFKWCIPDGFHFWPAPPENVMITETATQKTYSDGEDLFTFPAPSGIGTITKVSVCSYQQGKGKTALKLGSAATDYGILTTEDFAFAWNITEYTEKPGGGAWSWSDIAAGNLKAGIYLSCDGTFYISKCRRLKVVITKLVDGIQEEETLWPSGDVASGTCRVIAGSPLSDGTWPDEWLDVASVAYPILESVTAANASATTDRYCMSDMSEVPPRFSQINSIKISARYRATSYLPTSSYARLFIEVGGVKYYGSSQQMGSDLTVNQYIEQTWITNPTPQGELQFPWDYDGFKGIKFGIHYHAGGKGGVTTMYLYELDAEVQYQESRETVDYLALRDCRVESFVQYAQNPIKPDDLVFFSPYNIPERAEILYVQGGSRRFQGIVWTFAELGIDGQFRVYCKAQQIMLDYRAFSGYSYYPQNENYDQLFSLDDLFSDNCPTHPNWAHMCKTQNVAPYDDLIQAHESGVGLFFIINSAMPEGTGKSTGKIPLAAKYATGRPMFALDHYAVASPKYYVRSTSSDVLGYDTASGKWKTYTNVTAPARICGSGYVLHPAWGVVEVVNNGIAGGLLRLGLQSSLACNEEHYAVSGDDIYVMPWPESRIILFDHAFDTHLRPGSFDDGNNSYLNIPNMFFGQVSKSFDTLFQKIGFELQFLPERDGCVHMSAASEISRGSAENPLHKFVDGVNCQIKSTIPTEPQPELVVGSSINPQVSADWKRISTIPKIKVITSSTRDGVDLREYLDLVRADDGTTHEIRSNRTGLLLRVGDWIWANGNPVRCRQITEIPGLTIIKAGKKLFNLNEKWGTWRDAYGSMDVAEKISTDKVTSLEHKFIVKAIDYRREDYLCRLRVSWGLAKTTLITEYHGTGGITPNATCEVSGTYNGDGEGQFYVYASAYEISDSKCQIRLYEKINGSWSLVYTAWLNYYSTVDFTWNYKGLSWHIIGRTPQQAPAYVTYTWLSWATTTIMLDNSGAFVTLELNGNVIPPGRIHLGKSGDEFEIDITDFVLGSETYDSENVIKMNVYNASGCITKCVSQYTEIEVKQQRRIKVLRNGNT